MKKIYLTPTIEILGLNAEELICQSMKPGEWDSIRRYLEYEELEKMSQNNSL